MADSVRNGKWKLRRLPNLILLDLCKEYLAAKDFVHRDLASRNVLITGDKMLKVSDFGLTRAVYSDGIYTQKNASLLPIRWMAIEAIRNHEFTELTDV